MMIFHPGVLLPRRPIGSGDGGEVAAALSSLSLATSPAKFGEVRRGWRGATPLVQIFPLLGGGARTAMRSRPRRGSAAPFLPGSGPPETPPPQPDE